MTKRDYLLGFWGAFNAFAVVAGNDGHWIAAAFFFVVSNMCLFWVGYTDAKAKRGVRA